MQAIALGMLTVGTQGQAATAGRGRQAICQLQEFGLWALTAVGTGTGFAACYQLDNTDSEIKIALSEDEW